MTLTALLAAGGVACSSGGSGSDATTTSSSAPTSTTIARSSTTVASNRCSAAQLRLSLGQPDAGAGQLYQPIVFVNTSTKSCELRGFPGVSLLDQTGAQIGQPATREGAEGATVTLAANGTASAVLHTANGIAGDTPCAPASESIRVYPPDSTEAITIRGQFTACGGFSVSTMVAGPNGR